MKKQVQEIDQFSNSSIMQAEKATRSVYITQTLRCLDCESINNAVHLVDSPICEEQKRIINFLMRKNLADREIYEELGNLYGRQSFFKMTQTDDTYSQRLMYGFQMTKYPLILGTGYLMFKIYRKITRK